MIMRCLFGFVFIIIIQCSYSQLNKHYSVDLYRNTLKNNHKIKTESKFEFDENTEIPGDLIYTRYYKKNGFLDYEYNVKEAYILKVIYDSLNRVVFEYFIDNLEAFFSNKEIQDSSICYRINKIDYNPKGNISSFKVWERNNGIIREEIKTYDSLERISKSETYIKGRKTFSDSIIL